MNGEQILLILGFLLGLIASWIMDKSEIWKREAQRDQAFLAQQKNDQE